jgi:hypothetical protein
MPPSTHAAIVATSSFDNRGSFANWPYFASAYHGGMVRESTAFRIARAQGRGDSNVVSDIGAISPGRWHETQRALKIGATFMLNVTCAVRAVCACASGHQDTASAPAATTTCARVMRISLAPGRRTGIRNSSRHLWHAPSI